MYAHVLGIQPLTGKFIYPVDVADIKSKFFRIPMQTEHQQLPRKPQDEKVIDPSKRPHPHDIDHNCFPRMISKYHHIDGFVQAPLRTDSGCGTCRPQMGIERNLKAESSFVGCTEPCSRSGSAIAKPIIIDLYELQFPYLEIETRTNHLAEAGDNGSRGFQTVHLVILSLEQKISVGEDGGEGVENEFVAVGAGRNDFPVAMEKHPATWWWSEDQVALDKYVVTATGKVTIIMPLRCTFYVR
ncbi:hypothetical protein STEG23_006262, partial [Scotinomys teguina]